MKKQKNNHARAKRKIKVLKLKNFFKRVIDNRRKKVANSVKPKGLTINGRAVDYAEYQPLFIPKTIKTKRGIRVSVDRLGKPVIILNRDTKLKGRLNQRQKRKLWRQCPHNRKAA